MSRHATVAHGFGLTNYKFVERFPFWSVDSTTWLAGCRFGAVNVCQGTKVYQVNVSDVAGNRLSPGLMRERYATLLGAGIPADVLAGKRRLEAGGYDRISFRAFRRWAAAIRRHHGPVGLRDGSKPDGFHLFLACNPNRRGSGSVADLGSLWWET